MKAMILAAGRGERMRPLTDTCPKPLLKVKDKPLIEYHIEALAKAGIKQIVINHAWLGQQIEDKLGDGRRWNIKILYSLEKEALETAGGIIKALPLLINKPEDEFIVVNGDIFTEYTFSHVIHSPLPAGKVAHLVMVNNPEHNPNGDFFIDDGLLSLEFNPKLTFSGIARYKGDFFVRHAHSQNKLALAPLLKQAIADQKVTGEHYQGLWCDVGTPARLNQINTG